MGQQSRHADPSRHATGMGLVIKRASAALLAVAILASLGLWTPALAEPSATGARPSAAQATTTVPFAATTTDALAGGVTHRHGRWTTTAGPQVVDLFDVDAAAPGIRREVSRAGGGG